MHYLHVHYFSGLSISVFSTFQFGKLVFCLLVFIICFLFFMSFKFNIIKTFMYVVYICAIWPLVILFSLYKNYFLFIKIQFSHMLVKTCFQRGFEQTKNHLKKKNAEQPHNIIIFKKGQKMKFYQNLQLQTLYVWCQDCSVFQLSHKIKNIH